jgi:tetratricopeptide (TPR) repeat protein
MADRYTYFPLIGLFIALVWLATEISSGGHYRRAGLVAVATVVLLASAVATSRQLRYWRDSGTLFLHTLEVTHGNYVAHYTLATFFYRNERLDDAIDQYQLALEISPDYADVRNDLGTALFVKGRLDEAITQYQKALEGIPDSALVHCNLGIALGQKGKRDEAMKQFQQAIRLDPIMALPYISLGKIYAAQGNLDDAIAVYLKAITLDPGLAEAHYHLGNIYISKGKIAEAIAELKTALRLRPEVIEVQTKLAEVLLNTGKAAEALPYCEAVVRAQPENAHAHFILGSACLANKQSEQAVGHFKQALQLSPDNPQCMNALAWIYATSPKAEIRNGPEAVRQAEEACTITKRKNTMLLDTLAAAYAEADRFVDAIKTTEEIRDIALSSHDTATAATARQRLELYIAGKAYRDEP